MKMCNKCEVIKPLNDFYKFSEMKDGYRNDCKSCVISRMKINNAKKYGTEEYKRRHREYKKGSWSKIKADPEKHKKIRESNRESSLSWYYRNKKKSQCHLKINRALKRGVIKKLPCEVCGSTENINAHHCDYNKPLDVMWLCHTHHKEWHVKHGEGLNA